MQEISCLAERALPNLDDLLNEIWIEVATEFAGQPQSVLDNAQAIIAKCLRYHTDNGHRDVGTLKALALEALEQAHPHMRF